MTKKYEKSARESEKAKAEYTKAEQADNVTKAKVEKLHASWAKKAKETSSVEQELANEIRAVNGARTMHFHTHIPAEMDKLQTAHETVWTMLVDAFNKLGMCYNYLHTHANEAASDVATVTLRPPPVSIAYCSLGCLQLVLIVDFCRWLLGRASLQRPERF